MQRVARSERWVVVSIFALAGACSVDTRDIAFRPDSEFNGLGAGTGGGVGAPGGGGAPSSAGASFTDSGCEKDDEGSARCNANGELEICKSGTYALSERCESRELCNASRKSCLACEPGTFRCSEDTLEQCNLEGAAFELVEKCAEDACAADGHSGFCRVCEPGETLCESYVREFVTSSTVSDPTREQASVRVCNDAGAGTLTLERCTLDRPICDAEGGRCVACRKGETVCIGSELSRCREDGMGFEPVEDCGSAELCDAASGKCASDECEQLRESGDPSALVACHGAAGTELSFCAPSGKWEPLALCDNQLSCEAGKVPRLCLDTSGPHCLPGSSRCNGNRLERCAEFAEASSLSPSGGTWYEYVTCAGACETSGSGIAECSGSEEELYTGAFVCTPGDRKYLDCSSGTCVERSCARGEVCAGPELGCRTCVPGTVRCDDDRLVRCDESGDAESVVADCSGGYCDRVREACLPARPGETVCSQGVFSRVQADGTLRTLATCDSDELCSPEAGCKKPHCVVGSPICSEDERGRVRVASCPDGTGLVPTQTRCASADLCEDGLGCVTAYRVAAGEAHTCVLVLPENNGAEEPGLVKCWGANESGQLGNGSRVLGDEPEPRAVVARTKDGKSLRSAAKFLRTGLCAGKNFTCADSEIEVQVGGEAKSEPGVVCWGDNERGQLGIGAVLGPNDPASAQQNAVTLPVSRVRDGAPRDSVAEPFARLHGVTCGADFACALDETGAAWCWGANDAGQLGIGMATETPWSSARRVDGGDEEPGLPKYRRITAGAAHVCALDQRGTPWCWGRAVKSEQAESRTWGLPEPLAFEDQGFESQGLALGRDFTLLDATDQGVLALGQNFFGQLGTSSTVKSAASPVRATELGRARVAALFGGPTAAHACALVDGSLACWGANSLGQLGDGTTEDRGAPVIALEGKRVEVYAGASDGGSVALGRSHTCAVDASGGLWCWGGNERGQLGRAVSEPFTATPAEVFRDE